MQFYNVKEQIVKHFDSRSASQRQRGKTVLDVVITDCWCVCSGTMHAPSAMNVCIVRERERGEREGEKERGSYLFTQYIVTQARLIDLGKCIPCQDITLT